MLVSFSNSRVPDRLFSFLGIIFLSLFNPAFESVVKGQNGSRDSAAHCKVRMYKKRLKTYAKLGYEVTVDGTQNKSNSADFIFSSNSMNAFTHDIENVTQSIDVIAPPTRRLKP